MKKTIMLAASAALLGSVQAATISVNFTEDAGRANQQLGAADLAGRTGYEQTNWNNVASNVAGPSLDLIDSTGATTTADVSWATTNVWGDGTANTDADAGVGNARIARGYKDDVGDGADFTVTNIGYATYTAVLYFSTDAGGGTYGNFTVNGVGPQTSTGTKEQYGTNPIWDDTNSLVITGLTGDLVVDGTRDGANRATIAGFQIIDTTAIPEPTSTALLGLGGMALILRRRK
ncbi:PEP-CTERM sorting domain-containing protein [Rubritalea tangerina]|uniref:PEP-CTERM sorting domain-containing protein n=2 Tax=Rubritalea tangerina TaxID=430798 RepID=A0ABW4ZAB1_9BACT